MLLCLGFLGLEKETSSSGRQRERYSRSTCPHPLLRRGSVVTAATARGASPQASCSLYSGELCRLKEQKSAPPPKARREMNLSGITVYYQGRVGLSPALAGDFKKRSPEDGYSVMTRDNFH